MPQTDSTVKRKRMIQRWHWALVAAFGMLFVWFRIPLMGEIICDSDLAGIMYSGWGLKEGFLPYRDIFETKPPGTYFLFAFIIKLFDLHMLPAHLVSIGWGLAGLVALFLLTAKLIDAKAGLISAGVYALLSGTDLLNGICPNYETWAVTPGLWGLLLIFLAAARKRFALLALAAGLCLGLSASMKFQGTFFSAAAVVGLIAHIQPTKSNTRLLWIGLVALLGSLIPWGFYFLYYALQGGASDLLAAIHPTQGAQYAQARSLVLVSDAMVKNLGLFIARFPCLMAGVAAAFAAAAYVLVRKTLPFSAVATLLAWWGSMFFAAFFLKGLFADGHFYQHYLVIALPGFCALFGFAASTFLDLPRMRIPAGLLLALLFVQMIVGQSLEFQLASQSLHSQRTIGAIADKDTLYSLGDMEFMYGVRSSYRIRNLVRHIRDHTDENDTIFVWDPVGEIYIFAQRRAPTYYYKPYFSSTHLPWSVHKEGDIKLEEVRHRIMTELAAAPPKFVIQLAEESAEFPHIEPMFDELERFVKSRYRIDARNADKAFVLWLRMSEPFFPEKNEFGP